MSHSSGPVPLDFNPIVIDWLPPPTPILDEDATWHIVEENKFYYTLFSDHWTFDEWQTAIKTTLYEVTDNWKPSAIDEINAYKFSAFVIAFQCYFDNINDGCCMASDQNGALCIFRNAHNKVNSDKVDTYRFTAQDWEEQVEGRPMSSVARNLGDFIPVDKKSEP